MGKMIQYALYMQEALGLAAQALFSQSLWPKLSKEYEHDQEDERRRSA
jgi:hypothetical protein